MHGEVPRCIPSKLQCIFRCHFQFPILQSSCCFTRSAPKSSKCLARVVVPSVRRHHHITPTLKTLHWLPIRQRISFKIAAITNKTLQNHQPSYLSDLIVPYIPTRNLRSLDKFLLTVPDIRSANSRRSFSFAAPSIWNSLPLPLRSCPTLPLFLSFLKTHPFPP